MKQPTDELIQDASKKAFEDSMFSATKPLNLPFRLAFERAIEWLLNWQKSQPLEVFLVKDNNANIREICRTKEHAEIVAESLKKEYNLDFPITKYIVFK